MDLPWFTEQVTIINHGMVHTIIQGHGHGDSTLLILLISDGDLDGAIARVGSVSDLDMVTVMDTEPDIMDMVTADVAGGDLPFIILRVGEDIMAGQGLMVSTEIISMYIIISMSIMRIMFTEAVGVYPARVIIVQEELPAGR